ncbi:ATP-binding cassette sub-family G member 2 [Octodon degus]|uniref:ATP-binding cassette sub-family G member 2 n=1 Tax=Octodon degus TaxID=10160 RepID=A0A6P3FMH8_OCTDE|nr:ATP-binding cassette sub-family G member 2 [Octodon degus]
MSSSNDKVSIPMLNKNTKDPPSMTSSDLKTSTEAIVLSFHNISYQVKVQSSTLLFWKSEMKSILSNISGIMKPGLNAIMGPTSAGKSVLLDVLASRKDPHGLSGDVLMNGEPLPANFKYCSGYVAQVRGDLLHGLSGAERKRTSIAMELITDPSILFLDEPTNGLDSSTAHSILLLLKRMSREGQTIIFSIRQPRYSIFKMFESITLLAAGKLIFHGPAQMAVEHFTSAGYNFDNYTNPEDFFLDVIYEVSTTVESENMEEDHKSEKIEEFPGRDEPLIQNLAALYDSSCYYQGIKAELDQLSDGQKKSLAFKESTYATSFWHQFRWISWRSLKNFLGDRKTSIAQIIPPVIEGLIMGAYYLGIKNDCTTIQNRAWIFYLLIVSIFFTYWSAVKLFLGEKKLFIQGPGKIKFVGLAIKLKELQVWDLIIKSQCFRGSSDKGAKKSSLISRGLEEIKQWIHQQIRVGRTMKTGLKPTVGAFFIMLLTLLMVACSADSLALAMTIDQTVLLSLLGFLMGNYFRVMVIYWFMVVFFGSTWSRLSWLQYVNIPFYGLTALQHNEFWGQNFCTQLKTGGSGCLNYVICTGEEFLTTLGIDISLWSLWKNHVALAVVMIFFFTVAFLKLLFCKKYS